MLSSYTYEYRLDGNQTFACASSSSSLGMAEEYVYNGLNQQVSVIKGGEVDGFVRLYGGHNGGMGRDEP